MSENVSEPIGGQPKSKLDTLSREELIRFLKKQVENTKECKQELVLLKQTLKEKNVSEQAVAVQINELVAQKSLLARRVEELEGKQDFLQESIKNDDCESSASELLLKARVAELELEFAKHEAAKSEWTTQKTRLSDDCESSQAMVLELRSQLEDSRAEAIALREKRAVADVFSLELKDYEKKVDQLQKEVKDINGYLSAAKKEIEELSSSLVDVRSANSSLHDDLLKSRETAETLRKELYEEKVRSGQLSTDLACVQERLDALQDDRGCERMGLGRELAAGQHRITMLEEAVETLHEENGRLKVERDASEARAADLAKDYDSFKSRARFVLEQKAKTEEDDMRAEELNQRDELIRELKDAAALVKSQQSVQQEELARLREQNSKLTTEARVHRRDAEDSQVALATTMDQLRVSRSEVERAVEDASRLAVRLADNELLLRDSALIKEKLESLLNSERSRWESENQSLTNQIFEEKHLKEEVVAQLEATRREQRSAKPPPIAAVFPQFSERELPAVEPRCHSAISDKLSSDEITQLQDRTLEDVLFGEDSASVGDVIDSSQSLPSFEDIVSELEQLRKHSMHTRELLSESESANGRLAEQTRLLKDEIRRLERNEERTSHLENVEYLKNVIVKFLTPERVAAEKCQLIPILNTMLRLSADEVAILQRAAESDGATSSAATWGTVLRWGGLS